jgi:hypothetical protein
MCMMFRIESNDLVNRGRKTFIVQAISMKSDVLTAVNMKYGMGRIL